MTTTTFSPEIIIQVAKQDAQEAFDNYEPSNPNIFGVAHALIRVDSRTKLGKELRSLGGRADYGPSQQWFSFIDMVNSNTQSLEHQESAVKAFVDVLNYCGINASVVTKEL